MMGMVISIAGAVQFAGWVMALLEAIEKPSVPPPTNQARYREPTHDPEWSRYHEYSGFRRESQWRK